MAASRVLAHENHGELIEFDTTITAGDEDWYNWKNYEVVDPSIKNVGDWVEKQKTLFSQAVAAFGVLNSGEASAEEANLESARHECQYRASVLSAIDGAVNHIKDRFSMEEKEIWAKHYPADIEYFISVVEDNLEPHSDAECSIKLWLNWS